MDRDKGMMNSIIGLVAGVLFGAYGAMALYLNA